MPTARRPLHSKAHAPCPFGQTSWSDCDKEAGHQWGPCKAVVGDREPTPCSRWAADDSGWCSQHYTALMEKTKAEARESERKLQLEKRLAAYFAERGEVPHTCEPGMCPFSHRSPTHVCSPECSWSPEALAKGAERQAAIAAADKMMAAGGGLEPPTSRVTADRSTAELPRKGRPHRIAMPGRRPHRIG